jgi:transcriptional regulator ATRX
MWDAVIETLDQLKSQKTREGEGSGCILAHCMGLGKTLSVCIVDLLVYLSV